MTMFTIKYKSRTWLVMQCLKDFGPQTRSALVGSPDEKHAVANSITSLLRSGYVRRLDGDVVELTRSGSHLLRQINNEVCPEGNAAGKREISAGTTDRGYEAPELRRTCLRPGAYDAFELPSLIGGQRSYRREIRA